jgi:hypothetical protein
MLSASVPFDPERQLRCSMFGIRARLKIQEPDPPFEDEALLIQMPSRDISNLIWELLSAVQLFNVIATSAVLLV